MKKCPYCAEEIQDEAIVCKHCGRDLQVSGTKMEKSPILAGILNVLIPGLGMVYAGRWWEGVIGFFVFGFFYWMFLFMARIANSANPPWPDAICSGGAVLLAAFIAFISGVNQAKDYNKKLAGKKR